MSKKETFEKFLKFMEKWHYEDFNAFETHFNKLLSMKGREQLTNENEALKDSIAVILAQKKNVNEQIDQLKQQLAEKDKEIAHLKEKDNYHLRYELAGADETITNLKKQIEEKDKEIESLHETISNKVTSAYGADLMAKSIQFFLEKENHELKQHQTKLAIQELEKVKEYADKDFREHCYIDAVQLEKFINQQIKELKGE